MSELSILSETLDKLSPESLYDYCQISEEDVQKIKQEVNPQYLVILNHKREGSIVACLHIFGFTSVSIRNKITDVRAKVPALLCNTIDYSPNGSPRSITAQIKVPVFSLAVNGYELQSLTKEEFDEKMNEFTKLL